MTNTTKTFGFQVYGDEKFHFFAKAEDAVYFRGVLVAGGLSCSNVVAL
jgi:hypothetical protein